MRHTERQSRIWPALVVLFGLPIVLLIARWPGMPTAELLNEHVSLGSLPAPLQQRLAHILFVPLGAMLVVLVRLTLGIRVLGPFRSILLAVAFQISGVLLGLVFLVITTAIVVAVRPAIHALRMPYFGRVTVMLSSVAVLMVLGVMASGWLELAALGTIAYFPIVVLCLVADAFARTWDREGVGSALWRGASTALVAVILSALAGVPQLADSLLQFPELLIAQIGCIIVISRRMAWRLLQDWNPKAGDDSSDEREENEEGGVTVRRRATASRPDQKVSGEAHLTAAATENYARDRRTTQSQTPA